MLKENDVIGKLTLIKKVKTIESGKYRCKWLCQCECGNTKIIRADSLISKATLSCGCYQKEVVKEKLTKHKDSARKQKARLYVIWINMKQRCLNPRNNNYKYYGGKGIKICNEWIDSYELFKKWALENGYKSNLTIDRIDVSGNYEPSNCRWITMKNQSINRTNTKLITYKGQTKPLVEWCEILQINYKRIANRLDNGWDVEEAFTIPKYKNRKAIL